MAPLKVSRPERVPAAAAAGRFLCQEVHRATPELLRFPLVSHAFHPEATAASGAGGDKRGGSPREASPAVPAPGGPCPGRWAWEDVAYVILVGCPGPESHGYN